MPNLALFGERDFDGNPFLVHHYWSQLGVRAFWNLFLIPQQLQERRIAQNQQEFAKISRLALSVGVMTQVHLAYIGYRDALNQFKLAKKAFQTRDRLSAIAEKIRASGEFHGIDILDYMTDAFLAKVHAWKSYSTFKVSEEQLNYSVGRPLYFGSDTQETYSENPMENLSYPFNENCSSSP